VGKQSERTGRTSAARSPLLYTRHDVPEMRPRRARSAAGGAATERALRRGAARNPCRSGGPRASAGAAPSRPTDAPPSRVARHAAGTRPASSIGGAHSTTRQRPRSTRCGMCASAERGAEASGAACTFHADAGGERAQRRGARARARAPQRRATASGGRQRRAPPLRHAWPRDARGATEDKRPLGRRRASERQPRMDWDRCDRQPPTAQFPVVVISVSSAHAPRPACRPPATAARAPPATRTRAPRRAACAQSAWPLPRGAAAHAAPRTAAPLRRCAAARR
jgi:hypothetical protein